LPSITSLTPVHTPLCTVEHKTTQQPLMQL
jgi:hypothetical protein